MHPFYPQDSSRDANDLFNGAPPNPQSQQAMNFQQQQQQLGNMQQQVNMDLLESLLAMQDPSSQSNQHQHSPASATPQALLEHQLRLNQLQQLQQLQNQIFQQQLELLSAPSSFPNMSSVVDRPRDTPQFGLPTPASSTELRAQPTTDFVSPMLLGNNLGHLVQNPAMLANFIPQIPQHMLPNTPHSAPANIVFQSPGYPLNDAGDLDLNELPPIPGPILGPYNNDSLSTSGSSSQHSNRLRSPTSATKRPNASSSGDESSVTSRPARKRPSPPDRNTITTAAGSGSRKSNTRAVRSATSTPLFPATTPSLRPSPAQRGLHDAGDIPGDTPSPVDPPMPPPAHPSPDTPFSTTSVTPMSPTPPLSTTPASPVTGPQTSHITPVRPADIFNQGRLAGGSHGNAPDAVPKRDTKPATRSSTGANSSKTKAADKHIPGQHISPGLKPIRPAGNAVMAPATPSTPFMPPQVRKSSHKAAEQKRRDSLKTSFDDLRILLPPIPLPSEEGYPDEPILPGAMPPRGPPKGNAEGPNRGVSKLQLLRCGNEYIRLLKGRVDRRDEEIGRLRDEVRRLREVVGEEQQQSLDGQDVIDLERDLDACEISSGGGGAFGRVMSAGMRASSVGDGDADDDVDS